MSNTDNKLPAIQMGNRGVHLSTYEDAYRFAKSVVASGLAPREFNTPEKVLIAIQYGAELGLSPMQALQSVAVINGRPCLWGDALPALVRGSGKCEWISERMEGDGDRRAAVCESKRIDSPHPHATRFSVEDAKAAGLWGKAGPWKQYPNRMLQMRARGFNFRDNFADVLRGFGVVEEVQDIQVRDRTPYDVDRSNVSAQADDLLLEATQPSPAVETAQDAEYTEAPSAEELAAVQPELYAGKGE